MRDVHSRFDSIPDNDDVLYGEGEDALNQYGQIFNGNNVHAQVAGIQVPEYSTMDTTSNSTVTIADLTDTVYFDNGTATEYDYGTATACLKITNAAAVSAIYAGDGAVLLKLVKHSLTGGADVEIPITDYKFGSDMSNTYLFVKDFSFPHGVYEGYNLTLGVSPVGAIPVVAIGDDGKPTIIWDNSILKRLEELEG